jgi:hypothetical protein
MAINAKQKKALKNKAEKANAPLGALTTIYNKGLGAAASGGRRPGVSPSAWAMARVNSVLTGGKARQVDKKQWEQIQAYRRKNKGKRKRNARKNEKRRSTKKRV